MDMSSDPIVTKNPTGYLASTPEGHRFSIGVLAPTEEEARRGFRASLAAWEELTRRPQPARPNLAE